MQHFHREIGVIRILFRVVARFVLSVSELSVLLHRIFIVLRNVSA